jgi:hypothetical protein
MLIKHLRLNFNAPGDKTDADANVWFGYPQKWRDSSKRKAFQPLPVTGLGATDGYHLNADAHAVANTDKPWLYTSGAIGPLDLVIRATNEKTDRFKVILHFAEMADASTRVFGIDVNGQTIHGLNIIKETGERKKALTKVLDNVNLSDGVIRIRLLPEDGRPPLLCAVEVLRVE